MPFINSFENEGIDDEGEVSPKGTFEYVDPLDYRYKDVTEDLTGRPAAMLEILRSAGATEFRVKYDGGCDEGFAHPDSIRVNGVLRPIESLVAELDKPEIAEKIANSGRTFFANRGPNERVVEYAVLALAQAFAERLLGDGFGTGEYTMYGGFSVDLETLEITDDDEATPPLDGNF